MNKIIKIETERGAVEIAKEPPPPMICYDEKNHPRTNVEPPCNNNSVFLGIDEKIFPEPLSGHRNSANYCMGLLTDFKEKMQQTELHPHHFIQI